MMIDNFAVFILTHGRPDRVKTYDTLIRQGYTGPVYIIIDNEDKTADQYKARFGDKVIVFDKLDIARRFDTGDNFQERRSVFFARNACFEIARGLEVEYFLQLDDDYVSFRYTFTATLKYDRLRLVKCLDNLFNIMLEYYKSIEAITIAFTQGGDFLGGSQGKDLSKLWIKRKAMNTFFCNVNRPFQFVGRVNEDVNTYTSLGNRGELIFSIYNVAIDQGETQNNDGGMTELYKIEGTYIKSFYTVMYAPSCTNIILMHSHHRRIHHRINWPTAVPCIVDEKYRKAKAPMTPQIKQPDNRIHTLNV
jgi:hypothetical protein